MRCIKQMIAAGIMALSLTIGAGIASDVAAKRVPPGGDSHQMGCYSLQQRVYELGGEYIDPDTTAERRKEILNEFSTIQGDWKAIGCQTRFGDIARIVTEPSGPDLDPGTVSDPGQVAYPNDPYADPEGHDPGTVSDPGWVTQR